MGQHHQDDLFAPSLAGLRRGAPPPGKRPWSLSSQVVVAVIGGPVAAGLVGYENAKRLGLPGQRQLAIVVVALAALVGVGIAAAALGSGSSKLSLVAMIAGAIAYLPIRELQKAGDRRYRAGRNVRASYDSLWPLGLGVILVGIVFAGLVMAGATA